MDNERPTPLIADREKTRWTLEAWLSERRGQRVTIPALTIPPATGMSNVTLLFDLEWEQGGQRRSEACVGRLQPEVARPVFPSYDLGLQYEVMECLARHSDIPVPPLLGLETDRSILGVQFYVMGRVPGRIPPDMPPYNMDGWLLHEASAAQRAAMWNAGLDMLARLHRLDYRQLGLERLEPSGVTPLQAQLAYWRNYLDWALEGRDHPICRRALDWLDANRPLREPTALCWGDARIGNIIFNESLDGVAAVLDWEMAVLGDPVQDLAWYNYLDETFADGLGMPRLPGLPGYPESIARWEQAAGRAAGHYDYYLVFAGLRFGLIMSRIMLATGQEQEVQGNFACRLLQRHLERLA